MEHIQHSPDHTDTAPIRSILAALGKTPAFQKRLDGLLALSEQGVNGPYYKAENDDQANA